jgi:hypothetical protein
MRGWGSTFGGESLEALGFPTRSIRMSQVAKFQINISHSIESGKRSGEISGCKGETTYSGWSGLN